MGLSQSFTSGLTSDRLEEYETLTYLSKSEILYVLKKFYSINPSLMDADFNHRFHKYEIMTKFPVLKYNPFRDRLFRVFSSQQDDCFSFEDMLDLCSAMSDACPPHVKAAWAFRVFDVDEDNQVGTEDIFSIIDRLVWDRSDPSKHISTAEKEKVAKVLLDDMDLRHIGSLGMSEFTHAMSKVEEFSSAFYFRL